MPTESPATIDNAVNIKAVNRTATRALLCFVQVIRAAGHSRQNTWYRLAKMRPLVYLAIAWMLVWAVILAVMLGASVGLPMQKAMIPVLLSCPAGLLAYARHKGARVVVLLTALILTALSIAGAASVGVVLIPSALMMWAAGILGPREARSVNADPDDR